MIDRRYRTIGVDRFWNCGDQNVPDRLSAGWIYFVMAQKKWNTPSDPGKIIYSSGFMGQGLIN